MTGIPGSPVRTDSPPNSKAKESSPLAGSADAMQPLGTNPVHFQESTEQRLWAQ